MSAVGVPAPCSLRAAPLCAPVAPRSVSQVQRARTEKAAREGAHIPGEDRSPSVPYLEVLRFRRTRVKMGDVVSSHLDESRREMITGRTRAVMSDFSSIYEKQYSVALFNSVRAEIEGTGGTQAQLLHRKDPLAGKTIFSGSLLQYLEENRKWRTRYVSIPNSYTIDFYESKTVCDHGLQPKVSINCAGYKVLTSLEEYLELMDKSLPGVKAKASNSPFIKTVTQYTLILWHPYARHHYFCVLTDKEHSKWSAVLQDCVRHANNGLKKQQTTVTMTQRINNILAIPSPLLTNHIPARSGAIKD
ncbi:protein Niban 2-like [Boleophthalmus pectinirostris]|uniref:protein Niban 2-like n=1 Tax=Boleophthalmus pectinirostris TaxID=150288 RepID=UPI002431B690|nr:protein Niban 2-like [Boleophthalmus pectinirostris]